MQFCCKISCKSFFWSNTALCWKPSPPRVCLSSACCWRSRSIATTTSTSWRRFRRSWCSSTKVCLHLWVTAFCFPVSVVLSLSWSRRFEKLCLPSPSWRVERRGHTEVVLWSPRRQGEERFPRADEEICRVAEERRGRYVSLVANLLSFLEKDQLKEYKCTSWP